MVARALGRAAGRSGCQSRVVDGLRSQPAISLLLEHQKLTSRSHERASSPERRQTLRVFYAFDPRRTSILPIGGDKTGNDRFYEEYTPVADDLYDEHLEELRKEGLIE